MQNLISTEPNYSAEAREQQTFSERLQCNSKAGAVNAQQKYIHMPYTMIIATVRYHEPKGTRRRPFRQVQGKTHGAAGKGSARRKNGAPQLPGCLAALASSRSQFSTENSFFVFGTWQSWPDPQIEGEPSPEPQHLKRSW